MQRFGFGDFVILNPQTKEEIMRIRNLKDLQKKVFQIPDDSLIYHLSRNHFSRFFYSRAMFPPAEVLKRVDVSDYNNMDEARQLMNNYFAKLQMEADQKNKEFGLKFLEENKKKEGIQVTNSGLQYEVLTMGDGEKPKATSTVRCHYEGRLIDGSVFDSSYRRNQPADFPVNQVIPGWTEALQLMPVGSKWRLFIPSELGYGEHGAGDMIAPNTVLIFDVELLSIVK
jgi:FKBP-type peptidyl-prolyl cis-trans isomerase FklB